MYSQYQCQSGANDSYKSQNKCSMRKWREVIRAIVVVDAVKTGEVEVNKGAISLWGVIWDNLKWCGRRGDWRLALATAVEGSIAEIAAQGEQPPEIRSFEAFIDTNRCIVCIVEPHEGLSRGIL